MAGIKASAVVLITPGRAGLRESGSGFIVHAKDGNAYVATCHHVVRDWEPSEIHVNGVPATIEHHGASQGLDIAVLKLPFTGDVTPLRLKSFARTGAPVYGYAFRHLTGEEYVCGRVEGRVSRLLTIQSKSATRSLAAWEITASRGYDVVPGNSGAPLIECQSHRVVGILSHAHRDGRGGIALSPEAVRLIWSEPFETIADGYLPPPEPGPSTSTADVQHGRFGGRSARGGRQLYGVVTTKTKDYFYVNLIVKSTDGSRIEGPARFFLHDTYPSAMISVQKTDPGDKSITLRDVYSYGIYTAGCQVRDKKGDWVGLEYNLADLPRLPRQFLSR